MIFFLLLIAGIVIAFSILFLFLLLKNNKKFVNKKKTKFLYIVSLFFVLLTSSAIYINTSNYWLGNTFLNKLFNYNTIENQSVVGMDVITNLIKELEKNLKVNKDSIIDLEKLAQTKFLIGDFMGAAEAYKRARELNPQNKEYLIGEANSRLFLESNQITKNTLKLFNQILEYDPNNLLAIAVLADDFYIKKQYVKSKYYYLRLLKLLEKDSLEYKDIENKLEEVKSKLNEKNQ